MIAHNGVRYWTTDELAASLIARGLISGGTTRHNVRRQVKHWADRNALRPRARTKAGGYLWSEGEVIATLDVEVFAIVPS